MIKVLFVSFLLEFSFMVAYIISFIDNPACTRTGRRPARARDGPASVPASDPLHIPITVCVQMYRFALKKYPIWLAGGLGSVLEAAKDVAAGPRRPMGWRCRGRPV